MNNLLFEENASNPSIQIKNLPALPEKKILGKFKASFIEKRRSALEDFLTYIVKNQEISSLHFVRDWFMP